MCSRILAWALLCAALLSNPAAPAAAQPPPPEEPATYLGRTLTEALLELERRGLRILFTSRVVTAEMRVVDEPTASDPRAVLDQLLAPHGLGVQDGAGGTLVVVPRPGTAPAPAAAVRGAVREQRTARPLAGVQILVVGTGLEAVSGRDGTFTLDDVPPGSHVVEARRPGFVVARQAEIVVVAGHSVELVFELVPAEIPLDEIVVTPSVTSLLRSEPVPVLAFDRDEIVALPHLGDDLFRALTLLPGTSGEEISAEFHIRGGRADEVMVMLDQLELIEPFHLRDFSSALSIIAPQAIGEVDLILGGFPARFGDRMGGVLDMRTVTPAGGPRTVLGVSLLGAQAGSAGAFGPERDGRERGHWFGLARIGSPEVVSSLLGPEDRPTYWDGFGKVEYRLGDGGTLGARLLHAEDRLRFDLLQDGAQEMARTDYANSYLWLTHQALPSSELLVDSVLSRGRIDRDRRSEERDVVVGEEEGEHFVLRDGRSLDVVGFKQDWGFQLSSRHFLQWGFDLRRLEIDYDYFNERRLEDPLRAIRHAPRSGSLDFRDRLRGEQYGGYLSDRLKPSRRLVAELGLRYDEHTVTGDRDLSPRVNLLLALGEGSNLRAAWGHFFQSQRLYELQVEDGETALQSAERTEQFALGFEHVFQRGPSVRIDAYHRDVVNPRRRYENIYEPVSKFPEIEPDRVLFAPQRSIARGLELFVRGRGGRKIDWWASYTYSQVEDEIDGRDVPRGIDQPHAVTADLSYRVGSKWTLNFAFRYHTGWPTTAISGRLEIDPRGEEEQVFVFGPINGERLPDYHRLDLRASRQWQLRKKQLTFFLDVQNLYNRRNVAGFDADFEFAEGAIDLAPVDELWGGFLPSFGVELEF